MSDLLFAVLLALVGGVMGSALSILVRGRTGLLVGSAGIALGGSIASKLAGASLSACVLGIAMAIALMLTCIYRHKHKLGLSVLHAPRLASFAIRNFDTLDVDGDGNITLADLWECVDRILPPDRVWIRALEEEMNYIGHVAGVTIAVCPTGGAVSVPHFAISRRDLETYPARIRERYESEFGERLAQ